MGGICGEGKFERRKAELAMSKALARAINKETRLLYDCEAYYKVSAAPITRQLRDDITRPLPDVLPLMPKFVKFRWPSPPSIDLTDYWRWTEWNPWKSA